MSKRIIALLMCAAMLLSCLVGCSTKSNDKDVDPGAYITMYLTDDIYDFDPANAYYNTDTLNVVSLLFDTLFKLDENGKVTKSLVDDYVFATDKRTGEHYVDLILKTTYWSNGTQLTSEDVVYAWKRLLTSVNNYSAASLLYDIKNARAAKEGDVSIDNVGIEALSADTVRVTFEETVDKDQFLLNLTSVATAPLLESYVSKNVDWAKKPSTMVSSGPFKLGKMFYKDIYNDKGAVKEEYDPYAYTKDGSLADPKTYPLKSIDYFYLERNIYYYRDIERDKLDKSVSSYRLLVDCSKTDAEIYEDYANGKIFFLGSIPMSLRQDEYINYNKEVSNTLSTFVLYMNEYALIDNGANGETLFANADVRRALSLAIDRDAIAQAVVYAQAATGLVAPGVFEAGKISKNSDFRTVGTALLATSANVTEAKTLLNNAGVTPEDYSFSIKVAAYDDVNVKIVEMVAESWKSLGFDVTVNMLTPVQNNDWLKEVDSEPSDVCDDRIIEAFQMKDFEVIAMDYTAFTADAYSVLSNFATAFSGMSLNMDVESLDLHITGYSNVEFNNMIEAVYYIPYYASLAESSSEYLQKANTKKPYVDTAVVFAKNASAQLKSALAAVRAAIQVGDLYKTEAATIELMVEKLNATLEPLQYATRELERAYETANIDFTRMSDVEAALSEAFVAQALATTALEQAATKARAAEQAGAVAGAGLRVEAEALIVEMNAKFDELVASVVATQELFNTLATEAEQAAQNADGRTLYEIIGQIYADNGITPTTDTSKWAEQKSILLHKAEEILLKDMPVIPVIFTQNATVTSELLTKVNYRYTPYYTPYNFTKASLKGYDEYVYYDESDQSYVSIFAVFPNVQWDKIGK